MKATNLILTVQIGDAVATQRSLGLRQSLPTGIIDTAYVGEVAAVDGTGPYTYAVTDGALPNGLSLDTGTGVIDGVATDQEYAEFAITATDDVANDTTMYYAIEVKAAISIDQVALPDGERNLDYSATLSATGGVAPYVWTVEAGSLPAGLSLTGDTIDGTATGDASFVQTSNVTIRVTDANGHYAERTYDMIVWPPVQVDPADFEFADGFVGSTYSSRLNAFHGLGALGGPKITWSTDPVMLPPGLTLAPKTGELYGTPTTAGTYTIPIDLTDALGGTYSFNDDVQIFSPDYAARVEAYDFGDGASTTYVIPHGFLTADIHAQVIENASGDVRDYEMTIDATNVTIETKSIPAADALRLILIG